MSSAWDMALRALQVQLEDGDVATRIRRVDVDRKNRIVLDVEGKMWFRWSEDRLKVLMPSGDTRVPLARQWPLQNAKLLTYRPGRRIVVGVGREVWKGFRTSKCSEASLASEAGLAACERAQWRAPRILAHDSDMATLRFHRLDGKPLQLDEPEVFFRIGVGLRRFQEWNEVALESHHALNTPLDEIDRWASKVKRAKGSLPADWADARSQLGDCVDTCKPSKSVFVHGDLHDGQFLALPDGIALLDFDGAHAGDDARDAANLACHLWLRASQGLLRATMQSAQAGGKALIDGLDRNNQRGFAERFHFHQCATFLRLALVYALRPKWAHLAGPLTRLALRSLVRQRA